MTKLAWLHFKCSLPWDWEPVAFSSNPKEGRLEFANRDGHLARVAWMECKQPPDVRKMMEEFQKETLKVQDKEQLKAFNGLEFRNCASFLCGVHKPERPFQAARYHEAIKTLTLWTFPSFSEELFEKRAKPVLESFEENLAEWRDWAIWGLDFSLPKDFEPIVIQALPANVTISFESPRKHRVDVHRWGLPELMLKGRRVRDFYKRFLENARFRIVECKTVEIKEFEAAKAVVSRRGEFDMDYLYGRPWQGDAVCWLDKKAKRLNAFEQVHSRKSPALELSNVLRQLS